MDDTLTVSPTATTPGLLLRPWTEQDIPAMVAAYGTRPLERLELLHAVGNHASCRVADKAGFILSQLLPPLLPEFPDDGHLHIRHARRST
jgi:hypothetical protein